MLTEERFARITAIVDVKGSVTVAELVQELDTSESTIRRDLNELDKEGRLVKVRGGAIARNGLLSSTDDEVAHRMERNIDLKNYIAAYAASLIRPDDFVYIDAGTTTGQMIKYITCREAVYVTNAVEHAMSLSSMGCRVYILGGEFKRMTEAIVGEEAIQSIAKYNFTKGFFGTNGITKKNGFTTPEVKEAMVKKRAMENCITPYILADHSKFGQIAPVKFGDFESAVILTDSIPDEGYKGYANIMEVKI